MAGREMRRSLTLSDQLSVVDSSNLRDLLKVRDDDSTADDEIRRSLRRVGTGASANGGSGSSRTLMDIIREEQEMSGGGESGSIRDNVNGTINWKAFKDRIRLRRAGAAWSDSAESSSSADTALARSVSIRSSAAPESVTTRENIVSEYTPNPLPAAASESEQPVRISLMALLEQTEGSGFGSYADSEERGADEEEEDEEEEEGEGGGMHACCVCMVRHKGAAFIPCGHTFCRLCSRELWVSRGNCPLCNGFILEILDIF